MKRRDLINCALEEMTELRDRVGETVGLAVLDRKKACGVVIAWVPGTSGLSFHYEMNLQFPLHTAAPGKSLLAHLAPPVYRDVVSRMKLKRFNDRTITRKKALDEEMALTRQRGYSVDHAEQVEGCHCVGATVLDDSGHTVASVWTTGTSDRLPEESFPAIAADVMECARRISQRISEGPPVSGIFEAYIVQQAEKYMAARLNESLDMEEVAEKMGLGYSWFRRIFRQQTGVSPNQFHMNQRLDRAKKLLETTELPIKDIALKLGYRTQDYFSSIFKKKVGLSPAAFRRQLLG
jgi:DNA-binding IclR family transcriptional regulator/AraC-like DNA-binding protein